MPTINYGGWGGKRNDTKGNHLYSHVIENNIVILNFIIPFETIILVTVYHGFIRNFNIDYTMITSMCRFLVYIPSTMRTDWLNNKLTTIVYIYDTDSKTTQSEYQKIFTQISDQYVVCGDFNAHRIKTLTIPVYNINWVCHYEYRYF
jgi:hypothetical protein